MSDDMTQVIWEGNGPNQVRATMTVKGLHRWEVTMSIPGAYAVVSSARTPKAAFDNALEDVLAYLNRGA